MNWGDARLPERFWNKTVVTDKGCWRWTACLNPAGYGNYRIYGATRLAHRVAYETLVGVMPEGLHTDHLCRNRACVNPAHLEPVTPAENSRRGEAGLFYKNKTHCPRGHEYAGENLYAYKGRRFCKACNRIAVLRYRGVAD